MRNNFDKQLSRLHSSLIRMGALCENAISLSVKALLDNDLALTEKVFAADKEIDRMEREIESECLKLLLSQQPVAKDLRVISAALKMISDVERIGDQASDIAELAKYVAGNELTERIHIKQMAESAVKMVTDSIHSFVDSDLNLSLKVMEYDDEVDKLFDRIKQELITVMTENPEQSEICLDLLMVAKYLERIGDHAENIAEWVDFSITGKHKNA